MKSSQITQLSTRTHTHTHIHTHTHTHTQPHTHTYTNTHVHNKQKRKVIDSRSQEVCEPSKYLTDIGQHIILLFCT